MPNGREKPPQHPEKPSMPELPGTEDALKYLKELNRQEREARKARQKRRKEEGGERRKTSLEELMQALTSYHSMKAGPLGREVLDRSSDAIREIYNWAIEEFGAKEGIVELGEKEWSEINERMDAAIRRVQEKK